MSDPNKKTLDNVLEQLKKLQTGASSIAVVHKEASGHTYVTVETLPSRSTGVVDSPRKK
jgi:Zn-dependent M16 (insulinase) family peptidase